MENQQQGTYEFTVSPAASSTAFLDLESSEQKDDEGQLVHEIDNLRNITIFNKGTTECRLRINNSKSGYPVPKSTIQTFEVKRIRNMSVDNLSATIAADVKIVVDNQETQLSLLKELVGRA